jgi:predicted nicotinamide N-methyase
MSCNRLRTRAAVHPHFAMVSRMTPRMTSRITPRMTPLLTSSHMLARRGFHLAIPAGPHTTTTRSVALQEMTLDLHAQGEADGEEGATLTLVMPNDWRDVPHSRDDPPFWVLPWPSGSAMAAMLLKQPELVFCKQVLDLGCGLAPAGIAAARAGASAVVLADRDECALQCALYGAEANGVDSICSTALVDWQDPELDPSLAGAFDVVLACDCFYDDRSVALVSRVLVQLLRPGGSLLVGLPIDSEYRRASQASHQAATSSLRSLTSSGSFDMLGVEESRGAQLPGMGPEGLAPSKRVALARLQLRDPLVARGHTGHDETRGDGEPQTSKAAGQGESSPLVARIKSMISGLLDDRAPPR